MNYKQIEEYILNIPKFRTEGSIEKTRKFYEFLGKPGKTATIIHVAGTNGKGSTCAYMNSVLTEAGYRVGMFTSPHLVSVRERMRINQTLISEVEFVAMYERMISRVKEYNRVSSRKDILESTKNQGKTLNKSADVMVQNLGKEQTYYPTFYEFLFFMAMLYFEEQKTEIIILETGLGGRLDATNVIDAPKVSVITEIGKDHMEYLGDTYEQIAQEKAGIIKAGSLVVYSRNRQETALVIEQKAAELGVLCKSVEKTGKQQYSFVDKKIDFSFFSRYYGYIPMKLNTYAIYQVENAKLALSALEESGIHLTEEAMKVGILNCKWEGRMEEILPDIYLDGAHNEDGIDAFVESVKEDGCKGERWLLFSAVADKEYLVMKDKLMEAGLFSYVYSAPLKTTRGIRKKELENIFADCKKDAKKYRDSETQIHTPKVMISENTKEGLQQILSLKKAEDKVYITGSLYLAGEIKDMIDELQW